nr:uncharacterized protein LOC105320305 isoform X3 [Crassostrea gigas]
MDTTLSMAYTDRKEDLMLDNENEEEEEGILTNKASRNTSPDMENKVKKRKKKKNKFKLLNDNEITYYDNPNQNKCVIELIDIKPVPIPDKPLRIKEKANPLLKIHLPEERRYGKLKFRRGNTPVEVIYTKDQGTMMPVIFTKEQDTQTQHKSSVEKKTSFIVLCSKGIIMVAAIVLISSSEEISKAKPCELEKALKSIIRKLLHPKSLMPKKLKRALFILLACNAIIFSIAMVVYYNDIRKTKAEKSDINFVQLKATMFNLLEKTYTSDNISSNDALSKGWNKFFIEYECCAINQVQGTTNDFDSTPWCTTSGSCQATASQIPKTCCNYVTEDDYGSAPSNCHSSVSSGTYKSNCMNVIKRLSVTNIEEYKISLLQVSLLIIGTLEISSDKDNSISDKKNRTSNNTSINRRINEEKPLLITNKAPKNTTLGMANEKGNVTRDNSKSDNSNRTSENSSSERENKVEKEGILTDLAQKNKSPGMGNSQGKNSRDEVHNNVQQKVTNNQSTIQHHGKLPEIKPKSGPLPNTSMNQQGTNPSPQIQPMSDAQQSSSKGNTPSQVITTKNQYQWQDTRRKTFRLDIEESRTCSVLLALNGILMVLGIVLIYLTTDILMAKSCDLKKALDLLGLDVNSPCAYNDIMDKLSTLCYWGIGMISVDLILFLMLSTPFKRPFCIFIAVVAVTFSTAMLIFYTDVLKIIKEKKDTDFVQIKAEVLNLLEKNYTSDNISSSDAISNNLNKFFIKYDCCAINQVQGTTNDFDSTPWCTTSGSCQATASQIPKTCCNYVSEEDYGNAPTACHSSVSPGTYKSNCMIPIRLLSVANIEEYKISLLQFSLLIIGTLELCRLAEAIFALVSPIKFTCYRNIQNSNKIQHKDSEIGNENHDHGATNKKTSDSKADNLRTEDEKPNNVNG